MRMRSTSTDVRAHGHHAGRREEPQPGSGAAAARPARPCWPELDILRGLAAVLMVLNHAGVRWRLAAGHSLDNALVFAGSLAPVVFFTVTGMGRGVQAAASTGHRPWSDTLSKVALLLLADVALWISPERLLGMDFLGFIGVSTLLVEALARSRRPSLAAGSILLAALAVRLALVPLLRPWLDAHADAHVLAFLLGAGDLGGFSYPPCPWLAFPVAGFLLGGAAQRHASTVRESWPSVTLGCAGAAALLLLACAGMAMRGLVFFRWGTISFAYTVLGFAAVAASIVVALLVGRHKGLMRSLSLPGTSSLVVVPVHYGLIALVGELLPGATTGGGFVVVATLVVAAALTLSRAIDRWLAGLLGTHGCRATWSTGLAAATILLVVTCCAADTAARLPSMMAAQLALSALFLLRRRRRRP